MYAPALLAMQIIACANVGAIAARVMRSPLVRISSADADDRP